MRSEQSKYREVGITGLLALFALERLLKLGAVIHFFSQAPAPDPLSWPSITLLQPITQGASGLARNLYSRALLDYPGEVEHLLICDRADVETQRICRAHLATHQNIHGEIILVESDRSRLASKIEKLQAALPSAHGELLCFLDDDVALRPTALRVLVPPLLEAGVGATFGLACYTNWDTPWSTLMSLFVNANALLSYIPLTYMTEPFTITGHCFALQRTIFERAGGLSQLKERIDDDHELARRVRKLGLICKQTPLIYDVNNALPSFLAYFEQMKRWFILPKQTMLPYLTFKEQAVSLLGSIGNLLPSILFLCALLIHKKRTWQYTGLTLVLSTMLYIYCERIYLERKTPLKAWLLLHPVVLLSPFQALAALLSNNKIAWRGQRWQIARGGQMTPLHMQETKLATQTKNAKNPKDENDE